MPGGGGGRMCPTWRAATLLTSWLFLTGLYTVKTAVEEVLILEVDVRGAQRVEGMLTGDRYDEYEH